MEIIMAQSSSNATLVVVVYFSFFSNCCDVCREAGRALQHSAHPRLTYHVIFILFCAHLFVFFPSSSITMEKTVETTAFQIYLIYLLLYRERKCFFLRRGLLCFFLSFNSLTCFIFAHLSSSSQTHTT